jgi:hypothetical protein
MVQAPAAAPPAEPSTGVTNPFPGPQAYDRRNQEYFFGRDEEIEELTSLVLTSSATLVYAPSGAGKSSLLQAGVAPALERDFDVLVLPKVHLGTVTREVSAEDAPDAFVRAVCEAIGGGEAGPASDDIGALAARERGSSPRRVLLVLDQFEEVFNAPSLWRQREEFFRALTAALEANRWLRAVIALRSDYLANLVPYEHLLPGRLAVRYQLDNLTGEQAAQAIRAAFDASGVPLPEPDLDRLLGLLLEDAAAPHVRAQYVNTIQLQIVCRRLWQELREKGSIRSPAAGPDFSVRESMVGFVDDAIREAVSATRVDETFVRWWLENPLITSAGRRAFVLVEETHAAGLPIDVVESLSTARLLRIELRQGSRLVELTHDSMVDAVQRANERWRRGVARRRHRVTLVLAVVLLLLLAAFPRLVADPPKQVASPTQGALTETAAATEFAGTGDTVVVILDSFTASAPFDVTIAERFATGVPARTVASLGVEPQQPSAFLAVPTRHGASYVVGLHPRGPESPTDNYSLTVSNLRVARESTEGREEVTSVAFGIPLERGTMTVLRVPSGYLQGVSGVDVLAEDLANGWAVVRSADAGAIAVVILSTGYDPTASDRVPVSWQPIGQPRELRSGEQAHLRRGDSLLFGAFTTDAPNSTLGVAAVCSGSVQMYSLDPGASSPPDPSGFTTGRQVMGRGSTVLPLDVGAGRHTFLLSSGTEPSVDCRVTLRDYGGPPMTSFGAVDLPLGGDAGVAAYAAALPGDAVLVTRPQADVALTTVCRGSAPGAGVAVGGRVLSYLPRDDGCTVWLSSTLSVPGQGLSVWLTPPGPNSGG